MNITFIVKDNVNPDVAYLAYDADGPHTVFRPSDLPRATRHILTALTAETRKPDCPRFIGFLELQYGTDQPSSEPWVGFLPSAKPEPVEECAKCTELYGQVIEAADLFTRGDRWLVVDTQSEAVHLDRAA